MNKKSVRVRRAKRTRFKIKQLGTVRLTVHRTPCHIYAQLIAPEGKVLACASTLQSEIKQQCRYGGNVEAAKIVGAEIANKGKAAGVTKVAFDRSGFQYHGRVQALAEAARLNGLDF